jgi:hypothetical protein
MPVVMAYPRRTSKFDEDILKSLANLVGAPGIKLSPLNQKRGAPALFKKKSKNKIKILKF